MWGQCLIAAATAAAPAAPKELSVASMVCQFKLYCTGAGGAVLHGLTGKVQVLQLLALFQGGGKAGASLGVNVGR